MYAFLKGTVEYKEDGMLAFNVGGVGYEVRVTEDVYNSSFDGDELTLYTGVSYAQDGSMTLYGLDSREKKQYFLKLTSVSKVGGKVALAILSALSLEEIASAVISGDYKPFTRASGVGRKVAERIVLELNGKLTGISTEQATSIVNKSGIKDEAITALCELGFTAAQATEAVEAVSALADTTEDYVVLALKRLGL